MSDTITNPEDLYTKWKKEPDKKQISMSLNEFREIIALELGPLENKWFEKGRLAGLAEAQRNSETALMEKIAISRGPVARGPVAPTDTNAPRGKSKSPVDLAKRATQLRDAACAEGKELSVEVAVRQAYAEAGVPLI